MTLTEKLKFVVLRTPYDNFDVPEMQHWYGQMLALRLRGYLKEHPYGILPADQADMVAEHYMICAKHSANGEWRPVMGMRAVRLSRCQIHKQPFMPLTHLRNAGFDRHADAVERYMDGVDPRMLSFDGSYTLDPKARVDADLHAILPEASSALHALFHMNSGISHAVIGGVLKFKVDRMLSHVGYDPLSTDDGPLPSVTFPFMNNEPIQFFVRRRFSEQARALAAKYQSLWAARIEIGADRAAEFMQAAE